MLEILTGVIILLSDSLYRCAVLSEPPLLAYPTGAEPGSHGWGGGGGGGGLIFETENIFVQASKLQSHFRVSGGHAPRFFWTKKWCNLVHSGPFIGPF